MAKVAHSASVSSLGSKFDDFLFAPVGEESNGMLLTVLSALARLGVDPWQEAAKLAALSADTATQQLASLVAELPDSPSARLDPGTIAARLIALLPRQTSFDVSGREMAIDAGAVNKSRALIYAYLVFLALMFGVQSIMAAHQPLAQIDNVHRPAARTIFSERQSPSVGK